MPKIRNPRRGSMQFWPRKRATRPYAYVRTWTGTETKLLGFAGYKVGMTHALITDSNKFSKTKGEDISIPLTIIECPPIKIAGAAFYKKDAYGLHAYSQILTKTDKELSRKISVQKKSNESKLAEMEKSINDFADIRAVVYTQPKDAGIGKKKPELLEMGIGGSVQDKLNFIKQNLGKEVKVSDVLKEGQQVDIHGITKGKGLQGPVKRFGVAIRQHKAEKTKRGPATLGPWHPHHGNYRVPHAGQMGYHQRTEFNKWVVKIGNKPEEINTNGGFQHYGNVKTDYLLVKGSVMGPSKRMIILSNAQRPTMKITSDAPSIQYINVKTNAQ